MQMRCLWIFCLFILLGASQALMAKDGDASISYAIQAPANVDNGAVVPVNIVFRQPIQKGESFSIQFNKIDAVKVAVQEGQLSEFMVRLRMSDEIVAISVNCFNCVGESVTSEVKIPSPLATGNAPIEKILLNSQPGLIRALVTTSNISNGSLVFKSQGLTATVSLGRYTAANPFFGFRGSIRQGDACVSVTGGGKASDCVTVTKDYPKETGKLTLTCNAMVGRNLRTSELEVDFGSSTVNGKPAKISETEIRWSGAETESIVSRATGTQQIISLVDNEHFRVGQVLITGECKPAQNKPTVKLF